MDGLLKDLSKLEGRESSDAATLSSVQASINALERWKEALMAAEDGGDDGAAYSAHFAGDKLKVRRTLADESMEGEDAREEAAATAALESLAACSTQMTESHKEWSSALNKFGKGVDKKFNADLTPLIPLPPPGGPSGGLEDDSHMFFSSTESKKAIDDIFAMHFARSGQQEVAEVFMKESGAKLPNDKLQHFASLRRITDAVRLGDLAPAFRWVAEHQSFLKARQSPLEYHLHRSQYVRLLLSDTSPLPSTLASSPYATGSASAAVSTNGLNHESHTPASKGASRALAYARINFKQFYPEHISEIARLSAAALYLPFERLLQSPYKDLFTDEGPEKSTSDIANNLYHAPHLIPLFSSEYCTSLNMSKDLPLKVVTDIGGGGALAKIAKVRGVMKEKRTNWSTVTELPVEIPVPPEYRYHSVFACPVSKEQATPANPPMMMPCGHTVAKQTLLRLCKGGQNVRCPYCPLSSAVNQAIQVTF